MVQLVEGVGQFASENNTDCATATEFHRFRLLVSIWIDSECVEHSLIVSAGCGLFR